MFLKTYFKRTSLRIRYDIRKTFKKIYSKLHKNGGRLRMTHL
ncbi:hypothetical protein LEP1GSC125_4097 [Leptospira mayottensis 200901122]|uniref:Uncharacterized protein n=1 Tax=Leptospira mayottensis 200901122 TaxID=1193010 RepID=A0AA87MQK4_9LEPT|nr:hypothetical protein LEP1GSC125_4097 [Leptospira mayottensis 200901122]